MFSLLLAATTFNLEAAQKRYEAIKLEESIRQQYIKEHHLYSKKGLPKI